MSGLASMAVPTLLSAQESVEALQKFIKPLLLRV